MYGWIVKNPHVGSDKALAKYAFRATVRSNIVNIVTDSVMLLVLN